MPGPTVYRDERTTLCFPSRATGVAQIAYPPRQSGAAAFMGGGVVLCWRVEKMPRLPVVRCPQPSEA